jgi:hypothetical protein
MPMPALSPEECRVLGTLIEKAQTTPGQYPMTLNGLTTGCNQKNNRDPVTSLTEAEVQDALDGLRDKGLTREAMLSGSRVHKFRHVAREGLSVSTAELVVVAELMLRGPQSPGEVRTNASRMMPAGDEGLASLESAVRVLEGLAGREAPLVRRLERRPGERAERWMQLLCPGLHPVEGGAAAAERGDEARATTHGDGGLEARVARLEAEVAALRDSVRRLGGG